MFMPRSAEIKQDTLGKPKVVPCSRDRLGQVRGFQNDGLLESCTYGRLISHVTERGLYPDGNGETLKCIHSSGQCLAHGHSALTRFHDSVGAEPTTCSPGTTLPFFQKEE